MGMCADTPFACKPCKAMYAAGRERLEAVPKTRATVAARTRDLPGNRAQRRAGR